MRDATDHFTFTSIHDSSNALDKNTNNNSSYISFYDHADDDVMDGIVYGPVVEYVDANICGAESDSTNDSVHLSSDTIDVAMNESVDGLLESITAVASETIARWLHGVLASPERDTILDALGARLEAMGCGSPDVDLTASGIMNQVNIGAGPYDTVSTSSLYVLHR